MVKRIKKPDIIILGLGPGDADLMTVKAAGIIQQASEIYLRTKDHPAVANLPAGLEIHTFDDYYQDEDSYESVYQRIAGAVISLASKSPGVIYAVPGDPFIAEDTPAMILNKAEELGLTVEVVSGLSFLEPVFAALQGDPLPATTIVDAQLLASAHFPEFPPDRPALIAQLFSRDLASEVKLTLMALYPDCHPVVLVHDAGGAEERVERLQLFEIDRSKHLKNRSILYLPPLGQGTSLESFQELIAHLRAPEGCPWDREQDHQSLRSNLLEECYEALAAIDAADPRAMEEELGDLLLQIILQAQIASEYGEFTMSDVIRGIFTKIVSRHPHVFDGLDLRGAEAVIQNWERIKAAEREENGQGEKGPLDGIPDTLPALTQAQTYQQRAARMGLDWETLQGVLAKIPEEINELIQAGDGAEQEAELGDLVFTLVNVARWLDLDAESALRGANQRFRERFHTVEKKARALGRELGDLSMEEIDQLWEQSKGPPVG
jgi:tetrapyrrole methylase family protein/MazG family protein